MSMKIIEKNSGDLKRPAHGARKHISAEQKQDLGLSMKKHGLLQPIIVRAANNEVIIGDIRSLVAKDLGVKVPVIEADLSELESLLLRIGEELPSTSLPFEERRQMLADALTLLGVKEGATNAQVKAAVKQLTAAVGVSAKTLERYLKNQAQPKRKYKKSKSPKPSEAESTNANAEYDEERPSLAILIRQTSHEVDLLRPWAYLTTESRRELKQSIPALIKTLGEMLEVVQA